MWSSCDGYGAKWNQMAAAAPMATAEQGSIVALYNGGGSATAPTNTILYYSWADQFVRSSNNLGATWTTLLEAPWNQRMSRFVADTSNNVYMPGGQNPNNNNGDSGNFANGIGDVWFSANMGQSWSRLTQSTSVGYNNPVTLSTSSYGCASMAQTGGYPHRQLMLYSNWIEVYSATVNFRRANNPWGVGVSCVCDSLTGIRGVYGDIVFPSEGSPSNLPSSGGGSGSTYSAGQTAGIAVGVGVGVALLCCLAGIFFLSASGARGKSQDHKEVSSPGPKHKQFTESEPSTGGSQASNVEMGDSTA